MEPVWLQGDPIALGTREECPVCGELTLWSKVCENCDYNEEEDSDD